MLKRIIARETHEKGHYCACASLCVSSLNTFQASNVNHQFSEDAFKCSQQNVSEGASIDCEITDLNFTNVNQIRYRFVADGFDQEIKSVPGKNLISAGKCTHLCNPR